MNKKSRIYVFLFTVIALFPGFSSAEEAAKCMKNKKSVVVLRDNGDAIKMTNNTKVTGKWSVRNNQYQLNFDEKVYRVSQSKFKECKYNSSSINLSSSDVIEIAADVGTVAAMAGKGGNKSQAVSSVLTAVPSLMK